MFISVGGDELEDDREKTVICCASSTERRKEGLAAGNVIPFSSLDVFFMQNQNKIKMFFHLWVVFVSGLIHST